MEFCRGTHKIVPFRKSLVPLWLKRYGIRRNKIFILTFYTTIIGGVIFFIPIGKKKASANLGI
jgi:hypothetical protein